MTVSLLTDNALDPILDTTLDGLYGYDGGTVTRDATVSMWVDLLTVGNWLHLNNATSGVLDGATYTLSGDVPVDVSVYVQSVSISRGRQSELSEFETGTATIRFFNRDRRFDAEHTTGPYYGELRKGKRMQIVAQTGDIEFTGLVDDWQYDYDVNGTSIAVCTVVDGLANLATLQFDAWTATEGEHSGTRVGSVLSRPEVNYPATRNIDTGVTTFTNDIIPAGDSVLAYLQTVARAELGKFFASTLNWLTFRSRHYTTQNLATVVALSDSGSQTLAEVHRSSPKEMVRNQITVSRVGGSTEVALDTGSAAQYGVINLSLLGLPLQTDQQSSDLADYLVGVYGQPVTRFSSVRIIMGNLSNVTRSLISSLDIGSGVSVTFTPDKVGSPLVQTGVVEGINIDHQPTWHEVTLSLSRASQTTLFILDSATYGTLGGAYSLAF